MDDGDDVLGVEDPRITRIGDTFYMIYCGLRKDPETIYFTQLCAARSKDLLHWEKLGPMSGDIEQAPEQGWRPVPGHVRRKILAVAPSVVGRAGAQGLCDASGGERTAGREWRDLGQIMRSFPNPRFEESWIGAGSVPIPAGDGRYIMIYHTGNSKPDGMMEYDLDAALLDLRKAGSDLGSVVRGRIEHFMVPETPEELASQSSLQVQNVLFACGSYEYGDHLYIIYGGADTYLLAARVRTAELREALDAADARIRSSPERGATGMKNFTYLEGSMTASAPRVERLHGGRPVIGKCDDHPWENKVVFNTACVLVDTPEQILKLAEGLPVDAATRGVVLKERAVVVLLYRAQGKKTAEIDHTHSVAGSGGVYAGPTTIGAASASGSPAGRIV